MREEAEPRTGGLERDEEIEMSLGERENMGEGDQGGNVFAMMGEGKGSCSRVRTSREEKSARERGERVD